MALEVVHVAGASTPEPRCPLLFVPGAGHGAWCWAEHYLPYFSERGHDVYAMSLRGHAGSDGREHIDTFGLDEFVDDVLQIAHGLSSPPIVIGHSLGGMVIQLAVPKVPTRFSGAVLLASAGPGGMKLREMTRIFHSPAGVVAMLRLQSGRKLGARATNRLPYFDGRLTPDQALRFSQLLQRESTRALRQFRSFDPAAGPFPVPLLVLGSRRDSIVASTMLDRTARHYESEPVVVDEGCHDLMVDPTWEVGATVIAEWLDAAI